MPLCLWHANSAAADDFQNFDENDVGVVVIVVICVAQKTSFFNFGNFAERFFSTNSRPQRIESNASYFILAKNRSRQKVRKKLVSRGAAMLSGFVCTFHPATLGSSPKHTNYAFFDLYSSNCIFVSWIGMWKERKQTKRRRDWTFLEKIPKYKLNFV